MKISPKWHDDVIKWKHFPRYWPFARGIHRSPVNSPHKGQWRGALMFSLISAWMIDWVNNREAGDVRQHRGHYDVIVVEISVSGILYHPGQVNGSVSYQDTSLKRGPVSQMVLRALKSILEKMFVFKCWIQLSSCDIILFAHVRTSGSTRHVQNND